MVLHARSQSVSIMQRHTYMVKVTDLRVIWDENIKDIPKWSLLRSACKFVYVSIYANSDKSRKGNSFSECQYVISFFLLICLVFLYGKISLFLLQRNSHLVRYFMTDDDFLPERKLHICWLSINQVSSTKVVIIDCMTVSLDHYSQDVIFNNITTKSY